MSMRVKVSLGMVIAIALTLGSCGSTAALSADAPLRLAVATSGTAIVQAGQIELPQAVGAMLAGRLRLDIASARALPETINLQGATFVRMTVAAAPGVTSYVSTLNGAFGHLQPFRRLALPGIPDGTVVQVTSLSSPAPNEAVALLLKGDPARIDLDDVAWCLARVELSTATPAEVAARASQLLGSEQIDDPPASDPHACRYTNGSALSVSDVSVLLAAFQLPEKSRTATNLAAQVNQILGQNVLSAEQIDIRRIPGGIDPEAGSPRTQ